jgi:hypothetical protein
MEVRGGKGSLGLGQGLVLNGETTIQRIHVNFVNRSFLMMGK